ncbi:MAG: nitroreductase family protein [Aquincola sp.]|nr:nitroreductase family protein [Aquincola sp.]
MDRAQAFHELLNDHRSIRSYRDDPLPDGLADRVLEDALHGTSSSGNLNLVSVVKTQDRARKARLCELHYDQPMVLQAPLLLTFCADTFRTREWLALRHARPGFADFVSWHTAAFDAMILAQTTALGLQSHGLGICYMGTTVFSMRAIADYLEMPPNCLPVTTLVVGWPSEAPAQRDRLPPAAWIHDERYRRPTAAHIEARFAQREERGRKRYMESSPEMARLWQEHGISSLAQYYTSKIKYDPDQFEVFSADLLALLRERGFLG